MFFVVAITFFAKVRMVAGTFAALACMAFTSPALANSSSAAADIAAPLRAAQAAKASQGGDEEFRRLFSSWKSLDKAGIASVSTMASPASSFSYRPLTVSIPSRMPVEGATLTSGFGMRWHPVMGGRRAHKGVDLAEPVGTPVHAPADGVISRADWFSSYGLYISMEHGAGIQTRYGHLSRLNVAAGQMVHKGDIIGYVGSTGRSTGPHLHYEVRIGGVSVNPLPYMQGEVRSTAQLAMATPQPGADNDGE